MALFAEGILKLHWDQTIPVNLARIAKGMGVRLSLATALHCAARLAIGHDKQARLFLDTRQSLMRQRCTVAHALGHIALHHLRPGMVHDIVLGEDFRIDHSHFRGSEANDFALRLLIPADALRFAVESMRPRDMQELAHAFDVPALFIKQRMADLDIQLPQRLSRQRAIPTASSAH